MAGDGPGRERLSSGGHPGATVRRAQPQRGLRADTARAGRTYVTSRLGWTGFDGGMAEVRPVGHLLRITGYGGWGLARGIALPVTNEALNPLDDFQPRERQRIL